MLRGANTRAGGFPNARRRSVGAHSPIKRRHSDRSPPRRGPRRRPGGGVVACQRRWARRPFRPLWCHAMDGQPLRSLGRLKPAGIRCVCVSAVCVCVCVFDEFPFALGPAPRPQRPPPDVPVSTPSRPPPLPLLGRGILCPHPSPRGVLGVCVCVPARDLLLPSSHSAHEDRPSTHRKGSSL